MRGNSNSNGERVRGIVDTIDQTPLHVQAQQQCFVDTQRYSSVVCFAEQGMPLLAECESRRAMGDRII